MSKDGSKDAKIDMSKYTVDLSSLVDELLMYEYADISETDKQEQDQLNLVNRIAEARANVQEVIERVQKLEECDLDLEAQQKLLLATGVSLTAKHQLISKLRSELNDLL